MNEINAAPTKSFFVDMITRDIPLDRAILDLIDNSIDGAHRLRPDDDFEGLFVKLTIGKDHFHIADNCGGIPLDIAKHQAFRFGKTKDYDAPDHSIGRFGIGMKRALFKIGNNFTINSVHSESNFSLSLNVPEWLKKAEWDFNFETKDEDAKNDISNWKTEISVTNLHSHISNEFKEKYFITDVRKEVAFAHSLIIKKGFKIYINEELIIRKQFHIKFGDHLKPSIVNLTYTEEGKKCVHIKIMAGLDNRNLNDGGWYIFCNNRLIMDADKSMITGWDTKVTEENKINKYHADYAYFRGYIMFDSSDAGLLPWTTTKTGLDSDSDVYKAAYFEMRKILKNITSFLTKRSKQDTKFNKDELDSSPLTTLIETETPRIEFLDLPKEEQSFFYEAEEPLVIEKEPEPQGGTIVYWKEEKELNFMKKYFNVTTNKEVGQITFDYYYDLVKD